MLKQSLNILRKRLRSLLSVTLSLLILTACSTTPSKISIAPQQNIDNKLLQAPISRDLLIPCRVAFPLRENASETSLQAFYSTLTYNLGQVKKCYDKDGALIEEINKRDKDNNEN